MKTSIWTRLSRLGKLLIWLARVSVAMRQLDPKNPAQRAQIMRDGAKRGLEILNIKININNFNNNQDSDLKGVLIAANHVSWLDILAITALYPSSFIAMKELQDWAIVGKIIRNSGAVFIDRSNRKDIEPINASIVNTLNLNENVCFFPEARTSNGFDVLPLKGALFQSAINSNKPVLPLALRYYVNNQRSQLVTFSDVSFLVSLWRILSAPEIEIKMDLGELIYINQLDNNLNNLNNIDRFVLKDLVENYLKKIILSDLPK